MRRKFWKSNNLLPEKIFAIFIRAAPILVSVSVSGQYQHFLAVSESVKKHKYQFYCWCTIPTIKMNFYAPVEIILKSFS